MSSTHLYFVIQRSRTFDESPSSPSWYANLACEAKSNCHFDDSITTLRRVRIRDGVQKTINMVQQQEEAKGFGINGVGTLSVRTISADEFQWHLRRFEEEAAA